MAHFYHMLADRWALHHEHLLEPLCPSRGVQVLVLLDFCVVAAGSLPSIVGTAGKSDSAVEADSGEAYIAGGLKETG